jgi:glycosyltransferase involved in cell wall biosynthesis
MKRAILFSVVQTGARSNGGLQSITEVMLRLERHRPVVLTNLDGEIADVWRQHGFEVHVEPEHASAGVRRSPASYASTYGRYFRRLRHLIRKSGARVVHANDPLAFQLSVLAAKSAGAKIALNLRDTLSPDRRPPKWKYRLMFAAADHVFYLSGDMATRWRDVAPNATESCSVTYSAVDPDRFRPTPVNRAIAPVVLVMGVFWPKKGQLEFIRHVVPELARVRIETWFAGDFDPDGDAYSRACQEAAAAYGDLVRFLGYQPDAPALFGQSRAVAVPSAHVGLMRGMIEGMACGRPVVSFDVCSARELLEEQGERAGAVVESGDFRAMTSELVSFCRDAELASATGAAAHAIAAKLFAPAEVAGRYEAVYDKLEAFR